MNRKYIREKDKITVSTDENDRIPFNVFRDISRLSYHSTGIYINHQVFYFNEDDVKAMDRAEKILQGAMFKNAWKT